MGGALGSCSPLLGKQNTKEDEEEDLRIALSKAKSEADLRSAQILMIASELAGDPKIHWLHDRSDPRWTPTLQEAFASRQKHREDAEQIVALMNERNRFHSALTDLAERDCSYGDGCPTFGSRRGTCCACKARKALKQEANGK